jgi:NitT/TauT family transport system substrate-binding protein
MRFWGLCAVLIAMSLLPMPARSQSAVLRVAISPSDCCVEPFYAQDMGYFKDAGLNVEVTVFGGGPQLAEAVATGSMDIGISTPVEVAVAASRGIPLRIIAAGGLTSLRAPTTTLAIGPNSTIASAKDLEGKTVAVIALKSMSELGLREWLGKNHADASQLHIIEMPFAQMGPALQRGTIAAAVITEPSLSIAVEKNGVKAFAYPSTSIAPQFMLSAWFSTDKFIAQNPDLIKKFATAMYQSARWANAHHRESGDMLAKYIKIDPAIAARMSRVVYADSLRTSDLKAQLDLAYKYGIIGKPVTATDILASP